MVYDHQQATEVLACIAVAGMCLAKCTPRLSHLGSPRHPAWSAKVGHLITWHYVDFSTIPRHYSTLSFATVYVSNFPPPQIALIAPLASIRVAATQQVRTALPQYRRCLRMRNYPASCLRNPCNILRLLVLHRRVHRTFLLLNVPQRRLKMCILAPDFWYAVQSRARAHANRHHVREVCN